MSHNVFSLVVSLFFHDAPFNGLGSLASIRHGPELKACMRALSCQNVRNFGDPKKNDLYKCFWAV